MAGDFLYRQICGANDAAPNEQPPDMHETSVLLRDIRDRLQRLLDRVDALEHAR